MMLTRYELVCSNACISILLASRTHHRQDALCLEREEAAIVNSVRGGQVAPVRHTGLQTTTRNVGFTTADPILSGTLGGKDMDGIRIGIGHLALGYGWANKRVRRLMS